MNGNNSSAGTRGEASNPQLPRGYKLTEHFSIIDRHCAGAYGDIYFAIDTKYKQDVAIKIMPIKTSESGERCDDNKWLVLEQTILAKLRGAPHFTDLWASGEHDGKLYIVMDRLGNSLWRVLKLRDNRRFPTKTVVAIGLQMIDALETLHRAGYIHRDVKPSNMCHGVGDENKATLYLVDFNLARRFRDKNDHCRRERRLPMKRFYGTLRYASIAAHEKKEMGPKDDLLSLAYTLIELASGDLPWSAESKRNDFDATYETKKRDFQLKDHMEPMRRFIDYLHKQLTQSSMPDYNLLRSILKGCTPDWTPDYVIDWSL